MASSTSEPMPQTIEAYKALAQRDHDLIVEMKAEHQAEVSKLKARLNNFEQKRVNGKGVTTELEGYLFTHNESTIDVELIVDSTFPFDKTP